MLRSPWRLSVRSPCQCTLILLLLSFCSDRKPPPSQRSQYQNCSVSCDERLPLNCAKAPNLQLWKIRSTIARIYLYVFRITPWKPSPETLLMMQLIRGYQDLYSRQDGIVTKIFIVLATTSRNWISLTQEKWSDKKGLLVLSRNPPSTCLTVYVLATCNLS